MLRGSVKKLPQGHLSKYLFKYAATISGAKTVCYLIGEGGDAIMINYLVFFMVYVLFFTLVSCLVDRGFYCNYHGLDLTPSHGLAPVPPSIYLYIYLFYHYVTCFHKAAPSTIYSRDSRTPPRARNPLREHPGPATSKS